MRNKKVDMLLFTKTNERIDPKFVVKLRKKLKKAKRDNYTIVEISENSGVARSAIYNLIDGKRITKMNAEKLENYLNTL